jgi:hypothetical protein
MTTANEINIGDVVLPPERELRLWMRRHVQDKNLPESALHLHVTEVSESSDKRGPWRIIKTHHDPSWGHTLAFTFRARPETPWLIIEKGTKS